MPDHRDPYERVVETELMIHESVIPEVFAVISKQEDQGIFQQTLGLQEDEQITKELVQVGDLTVVKAFQPLEFIFCHFHLAGHVSIAIPGRKVLKFLGHPKARWAGGMTAQIPRWRIVRRVGGVHVCKNEEGHRGVAFFNPSPNLLVNIPRYWLIEMKEGTYLSFPFESPPWGLV